jgi:four helix bundle protein
MTPELMKKRTQDFAVRSLDLCRALPNRPEARVVAAQLIRCSASVGANYRSSLRARSRKEFIARIGVVLEEADEALFWLELIQRGGLAQSGLLQNLQKEANELVSILVATRRSAQRPRTVHPI